MRQLFLPFKHIQDGKLLKLQRVDTNSNARQSRYQCRSIQIPHQPIHHHTKMMVLKPTNISQGTATILAAVIDALEKMRNPRQFQTYRPNRTSHPPTPSPTPTRPTAVAIGCTGPKDNRPKVLRPVNNHFCDALDYQKYFLADKSSRYDDFVA